MKRTKAGHIVCDNPACALGRERRKVVVIEGKPPAVVKIAAGAEVRQRFPDGRERVVLWMYRPDPSVEGDDATRVSVPLEQVVAVTCDCGSTMRLHR